MALENARIDQLPEGSPTLGDYFVYRDQVNGITKKTLADAFILSPTTANYEWLSDTEYDTGEVVTYAGKWWQSLIDDNINVVPGTDPTKWVEISKSSNLGFWEAGLYTEDNVVVFKEVGGFTSMFILTASTPYISADFDAELASGDWEGIHAYKSSSWEGLWNFAANAGSLPTALKAGTLYIAEDDHGAPGDADYIASGTWFVSMVNGANAFNQFLYK